MTSLLSTIGINIKSLQVLEFSLLQRNKMLYVSRKCNEYINDGTEAYI